MKKISLKTWFASLDDRQRDALLGLVVLLVIAVVYYVQWIVYLSFVPDSKILPINPGRFFWWANDSVTYRDTGEWLFGRSTLTYIDYRPWLYPLLIGLSHTFFGRFAEAALWLLQWMMWLASGALIYAVLVRETKSILLGIAGGIVFYSFPTPLLLTYHGMTETLNIFLVALLCWLLVSKSEQRLVWVLLMLSLLTVTKPAYQIQFGLLAIYVLVRTVPAQRWKKLGMIALVLLPILLQVLLAYIGTRTVTLSKIGGYTFRYYLVALVYGDENGTEWHASKEVVKDWTTKEQLDYLWARPAQTVMAYRRNLIDGDLWTGSFFTLGEGNRMDGFAIALNGVAVYVHLFMMPVMFYYLLSSRYKGRKEVVAMLYLGFWVQLLLTGISTGQEDRLLITALPLWLLCYPLTWNNIVQVRQEARRE